MALDTSWGHTHLHRNEIFSAKIKEQLRDDVYAQHWVNFMGEIPTDGSNFKINSIGELTMDQASEATSLPDRRPDTGQFVFNYNEYVGLKTSYTDDFLRHDIMANQALSVLPDRVNRAFEEYMETRVLRLQREQNAGGNSINGARHRFVASGAGRTIQPADLAYVNYSLKKANAGRGAMIGIVDPSFEYTINLSSQVVTSDNPHYEGIIETGIGSGFRFIRNIYGIDLYTSNYLDTLDTAETLATADGTADDAEVGDIANIFFNAQDAENMPFIGAWRMRPTMNSWRDEDKRIEYHQMLAEFGLKLYRPENLIVCLSANTLS